MCLCVVCMNGFNFINIYWAMHWMTCSSLYFPKTDSMSSKLSNLCMQLLRGFYHPFDVFKYCNVILFQLDNNFCLVSFFICQSCWSFVYFLFSQIKAFFSLIFFFTVCLLSILLIAALFLNPSTMGLFCSSFSRFLKWELKIFIRDSPFCVSIQCWKFPFQHCFRSVSQFLISFAFILTRFSLSIIFLKTSSMTNRLFRSVPFQFSKCLEIFLISSSS